MPRAPISSFANGSVLTLTTAPQAIAPLVSPQSSIEVTVVEHGLTTQMTVYQDETSANVLSQPVMTSIDGSVPGWLDCEDLAASGADLNLALPGGQEIVVLAVPAPMSISVGLITDANGNIEDLELA